MRWGKESGVGNGAEYVLLNHKFYDLRIESKEWSELIDWFGWCHRIAKDWLSGRHLILYFKDGYKDKQSDTQTHDEKKRKWIFDVWYLHLEIWDISENNCAEQTKINKWILEFNKKIKIGSTTNRKILTKSKILWDSHIEYLRNL